MITKKNKISVGIIGAGYWGKNLIRNFQSNDRSHVKYVCDLTKHNQQEVKKQYPDIYVSNKLSNILKDKTVNLICIATPPETHFAIAKKSIEEKKNLLISKPMCATVEEAKELISLADKKKVFIAIDHTFVFTAAVKKIKKLLVDDNIGKPLYYDSERINIGIFQKKVNVIWDLAPHDFSIINYVFSNLKPISLQVFASKNIHPHLEDIAHIIMRYTNGFIAHIHVSWLSPVKIRKIIIGGDEKMLWYDDIHPFEKIKIYNKKFDFASKKDNPFYPKYINGKIVTPSLPNYEALALQINHILDCLEKKKKPLVSGREGLKVIELLEACDQATREKREVCLDA